MAQTSDTFLYLTTTGRTTGLPRQIEIWFVEHDGRFYLVSELRERANWVKNVTRCPDVLFSLGTSAAREATRATARAIARPITPEAEPALHRAVCAEMDAKYGWSDGLVVELTPA